MSLRIIGGTFRNRTLHTPKGTQTRPTLAIMRKAVFDICQTAVEGATFLDLFAGSGAMGIEALSRGATHAIFVDKDRYALRCIHDNIKQLALEKSTEVIGSDVMGALKKLATRGLKFDLIYIDPPYAASQQGTLLGDLLKEIDSAKMLKEGGYLFVEEAAPAKLKPETLGLESLKLINTRSFSQSVLHQFR